MPIVKCGTPALREVNPLYEFTAFFKVLSLDISQRILFENSLIIQYGYSTSKVRLSTTQEDVEYGRGTVILHFFMRENSDSLILHVCISNI